jgi:hypothetical protein
MFEIISLLMYEYIQGATLQMFQMYSSGNMSALAVFLQQNVKSFAKTCRYKISRKYVQWFSTRYTRIDRHGENDRGISNFVANASKWSVTDLTKSKANERRNEHHLLCRYY